MRQDSDDVFDVRQWTRWQEWSEQSSMAGGKQTFDGNSYGRSRVCVEVQVFLGRAEIHIGVVLMLSFSSCGTEYLNMPDTESVCLGLAISQTQRWKTVRQNGMMVIA